VTEFGVLVLWVTLYLKTPILVKFKASCGV